MPKKRGGMWRLHVQLQIPTLIIGSEEHNAKQRALDKDWYLPGSVRETQNFSSGVVHQQSAKINFCFWIQAH